MSRLVIAAVLDELAKPGPTDGLGVDLELGHRDRERAAFVVESKAVGARAELPARRRKEQRLAHGGVVTGRGTEAASKPRVWASTARASTRRSSWNSARR